MTLWRQHECREHRRSVAGPGQTVHRYLNRKKAAYERFGAGSYWVVVPDLDKPEVIAFELHEGRYREAAHATGGQTFVAARPFCIEVVPSRLVAGLQPRVR